MKPFIGVPFFDGNSANKKGPAERLTLTSANPMIPVAKFAALTAYFTRKVPLRVGGAMTSENHTVQQLCDYFPDLFPKATGANVRLKQYPEIHQSQRQIAEICDRVAKTCGYDAT